MKKVNNRDRTDEPNGIETYVFDGKDDHERKLNKQKFKDEYVERLVMMYRATPADKHMLVAAL